MRPRVGDDKGDVAWTGALDHRQARAVLASMGAHRVEPT